MQKSLEELRQQLSADIRASAEYRAEEIINELNLSQLRKRCGVNQVELARRMKVAQSNISKLETRSDLMLSTLKSYVESLGGVLEINACFPDGRKIEISKGSTKRGV